MGVASLILGIVSIIMSFIPCCNYFAFLPALVGLGLGIAELVKKGKEGEGKGMGIAGIILNIIAIILPIALIIIAAAGVAALGVMSY